MSRSMRVSLEECRAAGFTGAAYLDPQRVQLLEEVRGMCEANRCGQYGRTWACPPGCGTLEALEEKLRSYAYGMILQVTGRMEDDYDVEAIEAAERACKTALERLAEALRPRCRRVLPLSAGGRSRGQGGTDPDAPPHPHA